MLKKILITLTIISIAGIFGCSRPVATVNGEKITEATFKIRMKERLEGHKAQGVKVDEKRLKDAVLQELIAEVLMLQGAKEKGINVTEEELDREIEFIKSMAGGEEKLNKSLKEKGISLEVFRRMTHERLIIGKFIASLVDEGSIKEKDMQEFYKNSPTPFLKPERLYIRFIQTEKEEDAKRILSEMKSKKIDFDEMAERLKTSKTAVVTDYGWVEPGFFSPSIAHALKDLKVGQYNGPYKGKDGYYIFRLKEKEPQKVESYEEARMKIKGMLLEQRRQITLAHWLDQKMQKSKITKNL